MSSSFSALFRVRYSSKLFEVVYKNSKTFAFHVQVHINMPRTRFERIILMYVVLICPVLLAPSFVCGTEGMYVEVYFFNKLPILLCSAAINSYVLLLYTRYAVDWLLFCFRLSLICLRLVSATLRQICCPDV